MNCKKASDATVERLVKHPDYETDNRVVHLKYYLTGNS